VTVPHLAPLPFH